MHLLRARAHRGSVVEVGLEEKSSSEERAKYLGRRYNGRPRDNQSILEDAHYSEQQKRILGAVVSPETLKLNSFNVGTRAKKKRTVNGKYISLRFSQLAACNTLN